MTLRVLGLTLVVVTSNVVGNLFLSLGVKQAGLFSGRLLELGVGVALLILWTLSRMALLSWADLSFVLPVTAAGYVLSAVAGMAFLGEQISLHRWFGTLLITAGIVLVSLTKPRTGEPT